jgi:hypothetical protein
LTDALFLPWRRHIGTGLKNFNKTNFWATSAIFKELPKVNKSPMGENFPDLVTLSHVRDKSC